MTKKKNLKLQQNYVCHTILGRNPPFEKSCDLNLSQYLYDYHYVKLSWSVPWYEADKIWQPPCCAWLFEAEAYTELQSAQLAEFKEIFPIKHFCLQAVI